MLNARKFTRSIRLALISFALVLTTSMAHAVPVSLTLPFLEGEKNNQYTRTLSPSIPLTGSIINFGDSQGVFDLAPRFRVQKFDPTLGKLLAVNIDYFGIASGRIEKLSLSCGDTGLSNPACRQASLSSDYSVTYGIFLNVGSTDEISFKRSATLGTSETSTSFFGIQNFSARDEFTSPGDLAAYTGLDSFEITPFFLPEIDPNLTCRPSAFTILTGCSARLRGFYGAEYKIAVRYTYDDGTVVPPNVIPLPAGLPLMLGAIGMLGLVRRRR